MATLTTRVAALEAWKLAHVGPTAGHVLSGHTHPVPAHTHPYADTNHTHVAPTPTPVPVPTPTPEPTPTDPAPTVIAGPTVSAIGQTTAQVSWTVSEPATGWVEYGPTLAYGKSTPMETSFDYSIHTQALGGLPTGQLCYYRVTGKDQAGQPYSKAGSFTTLAAVVVPVPPPVEPPPPPPSGILRPTIKTGPLVLRPVPMTPRPGYRQEITEPTYGTKERRISDKHLHRNFYPTQGSFSWNGDFLIQFPVYGSRMIRVADWTDIGSMAGGVDNCQWSNKTNMLLWGVHEGNPPEVRRHNGLTYEQGGRWVTHRRFDGYSWGSLGLGDGNLADDDKMVIVLQGPSGHRVIAYDPYTDAIIGYVDVPERPFGAQISVDGKFLHVSRGNYQGDWLWHIPGSNTACTPVSGGRYMTPGLLSSGQSHAVMAKLEDGTPVWVTYAGGLWTHRLRDNERWQVLPQHPNRHINGGDSSRECAFTSPWGGHVSYTSRAFPGWVTLSSAVSQPSRPGNDLILAAAIDGSGRYMEIAHAQAVYGLADGVSAGYDHSPFAISDKLLTKWVWGSAYRGNETNTPGNETMGYVAGVTT